MACALCCLSLFFFCCCELLFFVVAIAIEEPIEAIPCIDNCYSIVYVVEHVMLACLRVCMYD